ncbi:DUF3048 domain-containing protein [Acetivibrio cellulolyticus]|uniref:DUF3048 domain-containing protein n=1 Tax=Acetivibrio cellulolyticus TaxID=35830 RepID=UPI0001E2E790|nr:DUF3048 domain-containing protein [Acetivibrio cellulolyticus]
MIKKSIQKGNAVLVMILILSQVLLLGGCGKDKTTNARIDNTGIVATPINSTPPEDNINSDQIGEDTSASKKGLTDANFTLPVEGMRPYAVMIDNEGTRPLPQGGIYLAQIVYEIIVEGGTTRLMPVFWGKDPTMIGPVRSSRHYFLDYVMEHDAIYVHFGYSPMALQDIKKFKINNINGVANGGEVFWDLTKDRKNWQDSYTSMEKVKSYVGRVKYRTETDKGLVFKFSDKDSDFAGGSKAVNINIRYTSSYTCAYKYDEVKKLYLRYRQADPHMERITGEQLTAKNIIIQKVSNHLIKGDNAGRQEVNTVGSGDGYYISNGKYIDIKWSKKSRTEQTKYTDSNENSIILNPGQTWVQITPANGKVTIE